MTAPVVLSRSRTYPFPVPDAFDATIATPLPDLFTRWFGPLPPVRAVDGPTPWGTAGQTRTITTADGGTMLEELVTVERPNAFTYDLQPRTGALKQLVASVDGAWRFAPVGTGVRIEWSWTIHPTSAGAARLAPVVGRLWQGYAERALARLEELLVAKLT